MILGMPWLAYHNPEINQKMEVKMTRCPEECGKQWRLKQEKSGQQKQKEEEKKRDKRDKQEKKKRKKEKQRKKRKTKRSGIVEIKRVAEK